MKSYLNTRLPQHLLVSLLSITLAAGYSAIPAEGKSIISRKIAYGGMESQLKDQGRSRTYYLYTPSSYHSHRPMPLVLVFHGHGGSGRSIAHVSRFNTLAEQKGFIVAYPDGINQEWSIGGNSKTRINDVSFTTALIDHVQHIRNIDSHRIYATGFSKGAILAQALACKLPNKIAAFSSVAGALPVHLKSNCQPPTAVSMLMINGTNDQSVPYHGEDPQRRGALSSVPATVSFWKAHDGCPSSAEIQQISDSSSSDLKVKISRYASCRSGSEVLLASVVGGGHFWPGGVSSDTSINRLNNKLGFSASRTSWNFFNRHTLP